MTTRMCLRVATFLAVAGACGAAQAVSITFSHTTPSGSPPFTDNFTLPAFDTSLGTLTGIRIDQTTDSVAQVDVIKLLAPPGAFTNATASVDVSATGPAGVNTSQTVTAGPVSGTANPLPAMNSYPGLPGSASSFVMVPFASFAAYKAPPSAVDLNFSVAFADATYGGTTMAAGMFFGGSVTVGGRTSITYYYDVITVPEPAAMTLLAGGLLGLGLLRRRR